LKTLSPADVGVFSVYIVILFGIGCWFTWQQKDLKTYLLADQNVHWVIVAISVMAALFSGISYIGAPAESFFHNLSYLWVIISFFIATPITTLLFLPFFRGLNVVTAYEYLERRFDRRLRRLASALFLGRVTMYVAAAIYAPALAISAVTNLSLTQSILITGVTATIYTSLGGMKAVIWTDTIQFLVLCGGIVLILVAIAWELPGGLARGWTLAAQDGKIQFWNFDPRPSVRVTVWAGLLGGTAGNLVQLVTDQIAVQRYLTAKSLREAQRALWLKLWVTLPVVFLFYLTGTMLYGYYKAHPERAPAFANAALVPALHQPVASEVTKPLSNDQLLPYFVVNQLPTPIPGLLIAALYGATMAVVSAGINSLATAALMDFGKPASPTAMSDHSKVRTARRLTFGFGILATALAFVVGAFGTLIQISLTIIGIFGGPLLGIFLLGTLVRRANAAGALVGIAAGTITAIVIAFPQPFFHTEISFLWIGFSSSLVAFASGWLASFLSAPPTPEQSSLTYRGNRITANRI
jgi:sodium-coupled monocarboxylate transporter 8/12